MTVGIGEFWKLAQASRLFSADDCQQLEVAFAQVRGASTTGNAGTLAEWLVANGTLSRFQAQTLLAGRPGPFLYGDYCVYDRIRSKEGRLAGLFRAVHAPPRHPVLLYFFPKEIAGSPEWWPAAVQQTAWACWTGHPYVSECYQLLELGRVKLVAIEGLTGFALTTPLAGNVRLAPHDACRIARQAALGLARLHQLGQIHNAIQPENIWLGEDGVAKLLQIPLAPEPLRGSAPIDWNQPDPNGKLLLLADYAAPELNQPGRPPDVATDLYALGATLFEMLTGWPPFAGGDLSTKRSRHAMEPQPSLEPFGVPQPLAQVVGYLLAKDPAHRYQQAAQVADALAYFVDPTALQAAPTPPPTLAAFDFWLQQQPRVPGTEPGTIPTTGQMAAQAGAQYANEPYATQQHHQEPAHAAEQPYAEAPSGMVDFASQYAADTYSKLDDFIAPAPTGHGGHMPLDLGGHQYEPPQVADPLAFAAEYAPAAANVAMQEPPAPPPLATGGESAAPLVGTAPPGSISVWWSRLPARCALRKPASKRLDPMILLIGGGGLLVVLLCVGLFIATRTHDTDVAMIQPDPSLTDHKPPRVTPPVDKTKGGSTTDKTHSGGNTPSGTGDKTGDKTAGAGKTPDKAPDAGDKVETPPKATGGKPPPAGNDDKTTAIADDGSSLWSSPTSGPPLELSYVAGGAQAVLTVRPANILRRENGDQFLPALGPWGDVAVKLLKTLSGLDPPQIKQVVVVWNDSGAGQLVPTITIRGDDKIAAESLLAGWGNPTATKEGDESFYQGAAWSYYLPSKEAGQVLVVGPAAQIKDIIQSAANGPPAMSRYLERILQGTDADRDINLVLLPDVLFTDRQWFFAGEMGALRKPMESFFGSETKAAALQRPFARRLFPRAARAGLGRCQSGDLFHAVRQPRANIARSRGKFAR